MSILGTLVRLDKSRYEDILADPAGAGFDLLVAAPDPLDVERDWDIVRFLFDRAGAPVNPVTGGVVFPNAREQWSQDGYARCLSPAEAGAVAWTLSSGAFADLSGALAAAATADPRLYPENRDWRAPSMEPALRRRLEELREFFSGAATAGDHVVFRKE
jgi:hypothetical protein